MNVSAWSIRHPLPAVLVFVVLTIAGLAGFNRLAVSQFPDITLPTVSVTVTLPGASPSTMESQVTRKVEDAIASVAGIDDLISTVNEGVSLTRVAFELGRDANEALDEVRDAVDRIRSALPRDVEEPIITRENVAGGDMVTFAVAADGMTEAEVSWFIDDTVNKRLFGLPGVGAVRRIGGVTREVRVDLRASAVQGLGVSPAALSQQLARIQQEQPGGRTTFGGGVQSVRTLGTVTTAADLNAFPIALPDGRHVRLSALADVRDAHAEPTQATTLDGAPVVGLAVRRTLGSSEVAVGEAVRAAVGRLEREYGRVHFTEVASTTPEAQASYDSSMEMLWEGALLAVIVVFWFLRDLRATFIAAVALPLSIVPTFAFMYWMGFSLNLVTLLALAVVVGILVDDAIVEVENIDRHLRMGKRPFDAALEAADEIGLAVIAISCTLAAVFVPVAFMPGIPGRFFREFGWTAATAVLFSLLVARLVTPMMAAYLLRPQTHQADDSRTMKAYLRLADFALRHRGLTLTVALVLFIGSLAILPLLPTSFLPPTDGRQSALVVELPPGTALATTREVAEDARQRIADIPELEHVFVTAGSGASTGGGPGAGGQVDEVRKATLTLKWAVERDRTQQQLEADVRARLRDLAGVRLSFQGGGPGRSLQLVLAGDDPRALADTSRDIERGIRQLANLGTVSSTASLVRPEVMVQAGPGEGRGARGDDGRYRGGGASRDARRLRAGARQTEPARPSGAHPRPARRADAGRPERARAIASAADHWRRRAARLGRDHRSGQRPVADRPLRPPPQRHDHCRSQRAAARRR